MCFLRVCPGIFSKTVELHHESASSGEVLYTVFLGLLRFQMSTLSICMKSVDVLAAVVYSQEAFYNLNVTNPGSGFTILIK